ncbi:MAG: YfiR family protein [Campylobacterales bacterium]
MYKKILLIILFVCIGVLEAYDKNDKLEVLIMGKASKYIKWKDDNSKNFTITILNNPYENLFEDTFSNKKINKKPIKIKYINDVDELNTTNVLYIPISDKKNLPKILKKIKNKDILTVSKIKGFAQRGGIMQIYFLTQKVKLKINLNKSLKNNLKISSSLLKISDVVNRGKK